MTSWLGDLLGQTVCPEGSVYGGILSYFIIVFTSELDTCFSYSITGGKQLSLFTTWPGGG